MNHLIQTIWSSFVELIYPRTCIACQRKLIHQEVFLCTGCLIILPRSNDAFRLENRTQSLFHKVAIQKAASYLLFSKEGVLQPIIHELKYHHNPDVGVFLGRLAYEETKDSGFFQDIDLLLPIPLHPKKQKKRGYNQAQCIAQGISESAQIPMVTACIRRTQNNPSQTSLSKQEREKNVANIFTCTNRNILTNKHILIIDDVITTGSTIISCIQSIQDISNIKISVFCIGVASNQ